jgi:hypothetical protein
MQIELTESDKYQGDEQLFRDMFAMLNINQRKSLAKKMSAERAVLIEVKSVWATVREAQIQRWNKLCEA